MKNRKKHDVKSAKLEQKILKNPVYIFKFIKFGRLKALEPTSFSGASTAPAAPKLSGCKWNFDEFEE